MFVRRGNRALIVVLMAFLLVLAVLLINVFGESSTESTLPDLRFSQFGDPAVSPYCLPYPEGEAFRVNQSYSSAGSHRGRFAYDFAMPFGSEISAAREGKVVEIKDRFSDDDPAGGHENGAYVMHDDRTVAAYLHFKEGGVLVEVGDEVTTGQVIGLVGTTGTSRGNPHLHFEVFERPGAQWYQTLPVNFRNAEGRLDDAGGLLVGPWYRALGCSRQR